MDGVRQLAGGKLLLDEPAEHVARLTIDNQPKRNALDHAILDGLAGALGELDARCLILTGAGTMFSAGYDIGDMPEETFAQEAEKLVAHPFAAAIEALERYPYPVVAAVSGHAIGVKGGLAWLMWRPTSRARCGKSSAPSATRSRRATRSRSSSR